MTATRRRTTRPRSCRRRKSGVLPEPSSRRQPNPPGEFLHFSFPSLAESWRKMLALVGGMMVMLAAAGVPAAVAQEPGQAIVNNVWSGIGVCIHPRGHVVRR